MTKTRTLRLTDRQVEALETLFAALDIEGQRGTRFQAGIRWLAETAAGGMAETVAALNIAAGCAAGEEWDDLIEAIRPVWSE